MLEAVVKYYRLMRITIFICGWDVMLLQIQIMSSSHSSVYTILLGSLAFHHYRYLETLCLSSIGIWIYLNWGHQIYHIGSTESRSWLPIFLILRYNTYIMNIMYMSNKKRAYPALSVPFIFRNTLNGCASLKDIHISINILVG